MTGIEQDNDEPTKNPGRSTGTVAYDNLKQDVPEEDASEASDDNPKFIAAFSGVMTRKMLSNTLNPAEPPQTKFYKTLLK